MTITNDPINGGRNLQLLRKTGLIELKPNVDYKATLQNITTNPKNLHIIELETIQLIRTLNEINITQNYPHYIHLTNTHNPKSTLLFNTSPS